MMSTKCQTSVGFTQLSNSSMTSSSIINSITDTNSSLSFSSTSSTHDDDEEDYKDSTNCQKWSNPFLQLQPLPTRVPRKYGDAGILQLYEENERWKSIVTSPEFGEPGTHKSSKIALSSKFKRDVINSRDSEKEPTELEAIQNKRREICLKKASKLGKKRHRLKILQLSTYIFSIIFSTICILRWFLLINELGIAPSSDGEESCKDAILTYILLIVLAGMGIALHFYQPWGTPGVFVGMLVLLTAASTFGIAAKGISHGIIAHTEDSLYGSMLQFIQRHFEREGSVPVFYDNLQKSCECCGFNDIDRLQDWPSKLKSENFPESCCNDGKTQSCSGLGRMYNQTRVPSGFTTVQDETFMKNWAKGQIGSSPVKTNYRISPHQEYITDNLSASLVQGFAKELEVDAEAELRSIVEVGRSIPSEIMLKFDAFVEELVYSGQVDRGLWVYFKYDIENLTTTTRISTGGGKMRVGSDLDVSLKLENFRPPLFVYYVSRGIPENILLDQVIWRNRCERDVKHEQIVESFVKCGDLKRDEPKYDRFRHPQSGSYFKWREHIQEDSDFFENALIFIVIWQYAVLPVAAGLTAACLISFLYSSEINAPLISKKEKVIPLDFIRAGIPMNLPGIKEMDPVIRQANRELIRRAKAEIKNRKKKHKNKKHKPITMNSVQLLVAAAAD